MICCSLRSSLTANPPTQPKTRSGSDNNRHSPFTTTSADKDFRVSSAAFRTCSDIYAMLGQRQQPTQPNTNTAVGGSRSDSDNRQDRPATKTMGCLRSGGDKQKPLSAVQDRTAASSAVGVQNFTDTAPNKHRCRSNRLCPCNKIRHYQARSDTNNPHKPHHPPTNKPLS